ncbi:MAG: hypothetical protein WCH39_19370 [Schlesneria sp.]
MSSSTARPGTDNHDWAQAKEKAKEAAASVSEMASLAAAAVGSMASHAATDAGVMASQAVRDVGKKADELAANAGVSIQGLGDMISKNTPESGLLKNASEVVAGVVKEGGEYLQEAKLSGLTDDVTHVIRRNPIQSVLIALGVGWFIGRTLKG